jgi:hypothetical protein
MAVSETFGKPQLAVASPAIVLMVAQVRRSHPHSAPKFMAF